MKKINTVRFLLLAGFLAACTTREIPSGNDYRLFKSTPIWELAQAVEEQNVESVRSLVIDRKLDLNYREPQFGSTLLMLTILNNQPASFKTLLELGADVNIRDSFDGSSAIILAADAESGNEEMFILSLLEKGADANDVERGPRKEGNRTRLTPLLAACQDVHDNSKTMRKVELLVDAGADVKYENEFGTTPLKVAATFDHYDVVLYLLEKGADMNTVFTDYNGKNKYMWDELRVTLYPLNSLKHKEKMKVIKYLSNHGIDYGSIPVPDDVVEQAKKRYPNNWKEYLEKY